MCDGNGPHVGIPGRLQLYKSLGLRRFVSEQTDSLKVFVIPSNSVSVPRYTEMFVSVKAVGIFALAVSITPSMVHFDVDLIMETKRRCKLP